MGVVLRVERSDGTAAVLKCLSEVGRREEATAGAVLAALGDGGAVRVLASADDALLMERCAGPPLLDAPNGAEDAVALPVIGDVVRRLHEARAAPPEGLATLADRCAVLDRCLGLATDARTRSLLLDARRWSTNLLATQTDTGLLHGDLHHGNIMLTRRTEGAIWVALDPQGVVGERAYEVANVFANPLGRPDVTLDRERPRRLADRFARELGLDRDRVLRWAFVHSCVSAAWLLEDGGDPAQRLAVAERIAGAL